MERFVRIAKLKIKKKELDQALTDALKTRNSLLVQIVLAMGANPIKGGGQLLVFASEQNDLELAKMLIPIINPVSEEGKKYFREATIQATKRAYVPVLQEIFTAVPDTMEVAIETAVDNNLIVMVAYMLTCGATLHINRECIKKHQKMLEEILKNDVECRTNIEYEAFDEVISQNDASELLELLLESLKRNNVSNFNKWLVSIAEECVETSRVDYMKIIVKFGLDIKKVSTRYCCDGEMREFMRANGAYVCEY